MEKTSRRFPRPHNGGSSNGERSRAGEVLGEERWIDLEARCQSEEEQEKLAEQHKHRQLEQEKMVE